MLCSSGDSSREREESRVHDSHDPIQMQGGTCEFQSQREAHVRYTWLNPLEGSVYKELSTLTMVNSYDSDHSFPIIHRRMMPAPRAPMTVNRYDRQL